MENKAPIHPSTLVYLFADQFSEPAKGLTINGVIDPRTGVKLNAKPLIINLYLSALMELTEAGVIRLETIEVKKLFGKEKVPALSIVREPAEKLSRMAAQIVASIQAGKTPEQRRVREVIIRAIGGRSSTYYPWLLSLAWSMGEAEAAGYIQRPEKKANVVKAMFNPTESMTRASAVPECVNPLEVYVAATKSRLAAFEQSLGADAPVIKKEIEKGIDECIERSSD